MTLTDDRMGNTVHQYDARTFGTLATVLAVFDRFCNPKANVLAASCERTFSIDWTAACIMANCLKDEGLALTLASHARTLRLAAEESAKAAS